MTSGNQSSGISVLKARLRLFNRPTVWISIAVMGVGLVALGSYWRSPNRQLASTTPTNLSDIQSSSSADTLPPPEDNSIGADLDNVELLLTELSDEQAGADPSLGADPTQATADPATETADDDDRPILPDRFSATSSILDPSAIAAALSSADAAIASNSLQPPAPTWEETLSTAEDSLLLGRLFAPLDAPASRPIQPWTGLLSTESSLAAPAPDANGSSLLSQLRFPLREFVEATDSTTSATNPAVSATEPTIFAQETFAPSSSPTLLQGLPYPYWGDTGVPSADGRSPQLPPPGTTGYRVPPSLGDLQRQGTLGTVPSSSISSSANPLLVPAPALPSSFTPVGVPPVSPYTMPTVQPVTGLNEPFQVSPAAPPLPTTSQTSTPSPYTGGGRNGRINTFSNP
ncbi:MAG: hypothetical protein VKK04_18330 [Synechococcales bacterium]|nr:hypothetical protein [Synechococcales bacterium]